MHESASGSLCEMVIVERDVRLSNSAKAPDLGAILGEVDRLRAERQETRADNEQLIHNQDENSFGAAGVAKQGQIGTSRQRQARRAERQPSRRFPWDQRAVGRPPRPRDQRARSCITRDDTRLDACRSQRFGRSLISGMEACFSRRGGGRAREPRPAVPMIPLKWMSCDELQNTGPCPTLYSKLAAALSNSTTGELGPQMKLQKEQADVLVKLLKVRQNRSVAYEESEHRETIARSLSSTIC